MKKMLLSPEVKTIIALECAKTAFSVIRKCQEHSATSAHWKIFESMRIEGAIFTQELRTNRFSDKDKTGDFVQLVSTAYAVLIDIMENDKRCTARNFNFYSWIHEKRFVKVTDKRIAIKEQNTKAEKLIEISPKQEISRKIREIIESEGNSKAGNMKAVCIDAFEGKEFDKVTAKEHLYYDFPFAMGETTTQTELQNIDSVIDLMNYIDLTPTQSEVLVLRLKNYGLQAIATYRGTSKQAVSHTLAQIGRKFAKYLNLSDFDILALHFNTLIEQKTIDTEKHDITKSKHYAPIPEGLKKYRENNNK